MSPAPSRPTILVYRRDYLPISETFIVDHLTGLRHWRPVAGFEQRLPVGLRAPGVTEHAILDPAAGRVRRLAAKHLGINPYLGRIVRDENISLIHAHFLTDASRIARFALRSRIPLIVTAHGYDASIWDREVATTREGRFVLRSRTLLGRAASLIVCVSDFIRQELIARGFPEDKLVTQPLGIDTDAFAPGAPASERRGVLFAGRLVEKKGADRLLEAWRHLTPERQAEGLTIIGDGPEAARLHARAEGLPGVTFEGAQPRERIRAAMRTHRVLAFPSQRAANGDSEGMPVVGMEAQAVGTPVVAFDDGPARELIRDGQSGLIVPRGDYAGFATALSRVMADDALADMLGQGGIAHARATFDGARNVAALERLYDRCRESGPGRRTGGARA